VQTGRVSVPTRSAATAPRPKPTARLRAAWGRALWRLRGLGGQSDGNRVTLFVDGDDAYEAMLAAIDNATTRVWLETYIFEPDRVGRAFLEALLRARRRGLDVLLLCDSIGSPKLDDTVLAPLREAGARVTLFNPTMTFRRRRSPLLRDHRKILIADAIAFCGGMNISEEYAGPRLGSGRFRDTHARVEGPAVRDLASIVGATLAVGDEPLVLPAAPAPFEDGIAVQVLQSDVVRQKRHIQRALYAAIGNAQTHVWLTTPYFVPPPRLLRVLVRARKRGVDVKVLTAGLSDVPLVTQAARHLYGALLRAGVRVYEMEGRTLHAKTATIDALWSMVGSFNLDRWSFERNLEVSMTAHAHALALQLESSFGADLKAAREVDLAVWAARSWWERLRGWCAYQLARL
jgi:cardiolipin synthase A/B